MNPSFISSILNNVKIKSAKIVEIKTLSPDNYQPIQAFNFKNLTFEQRIRRQLEIEKESIENSILLESFTYKTVSGNEQNRVVRLSCESVKIQFKRNLIDIVLNRPKYQTILVGMARFNMPIGSDYIGYGFNTGKLLVYFPILNQKTIKQNFIDYINSEVL
jgi:hypothetical protein